MSEHNRYSAWDHNDPLDQDTDYPALLARMEARVKELGRSITIIEYVSPSMKVLGKVVLNP